MASSLTAAVLLVALATSPVAAVAGEERQRTGYRNASGKNEVQNEGGLRVSVRTGMLKPPRGYTPLEVTLQNNSPVALQARLSFAGHYNAGSRVTERTVEVGPRARVVAWLPVPAQLQAGNLSVDVPGLPRMVQPMYLDDSGNASVLVLGTVKDFEAATGLREVQAEQEPLFAARFLEEREAPRELSSYVGYPAVVVAMDATQLPAAVWAVLETYAATGGQLVLTRPSRDAAERLPMLSAGGRGVAEPYGFGQVRACHQPGACGVVLAALSGDVTSGPVNPVGPPPSWERGGALRNGAAPLLESARAPVGRFLFLIFAFALAVGPGGLMLARRRGPVSVLVVVPLVSLFTCLALVAWSVLVDGFAVHSARYSLTWLDGERSRAVTLGVGAWYANLSPGAVKLPASSTLLLPEDVGEPPADLDWTHGMTVTDGFLMPRTYREWGEVSVLPSRARLVLRQEGNGLRVQNALGEAIEEGYVRRGNAHYRVPALEDGAEAALQGPVPASELAQPTDALLASLGSVLYERLLKDKTSFRADLPEGGFIVRTGGQGMGPLATMKTEREAGAHVVRGQVQEVKP
ncbi:hypothetical protein JY651_48920 [Pyxidicoccus parkwayensis]|uniref:Uncharacterized protein n=1 Tax=Pyxidicoccus parkwayensis TaxID=2813578 RepID=A0ABX7NZX4_9BACT|nr:hypothetical protein [Pyxidicoccus parkwaysis]QSQ22936.1 hypothetical protein JY651_48920 [Pyxidicoccus parkwaysis]